MELQELPACLPGAPGTKKALFFPSGWSVFAKNPAKSLRRRGPGRSPGMAGAAGRSPTAGPHRRRQPRACAPYPRSGASGPRPRGESVSHAPRDRTPRANLSPGLLSSSGPPDELALHPPRRTEPLHRAQAGMPAQAVGGGQIFCGFLKTNPGIFRYKIRSGKGGNYFPMRFSFI